MISLIVILVLLGLSTFSLMRKKKRFIGFLDAVVTSLVVVLIARGMSWNESIPILVWWLFAAWAAILVGLQSASLLTQEGTTESNG